jgi:hypothetical protein
MTSGSRILGAKVNIAGLTLLVPVPVLVGFAGNVAGSPWPRNEINSHARGRCTRMLPNGAKPGRPRGNAAAA